MPPLPSPAPLVVQMQLCLQRCFTSGSELSVLYVHEQHGRGLLPFLEVLSSGQLLPQQAPGLRQQCTVLSRALCSAGVSSLLPTPTAPQVMLSPHLMQMPEAPGIGCLSRATIWWAFILCRMLGKWLMTPHLSWASFKSGWRKQLAFCLVSWLSSHFLQSIKYEGRGSGNYISFPSCKRAALESWGQGVAGVLDMIFGLFPPWYLR